MNSNKLRKMAVAACAMILASAVAAQVKTTADAFSMGKDFAKTGSKAAGGTVNSSSGSKNLPNFTTTAPESSNFAGGKGNVGAAGHAKMINCETSHSPDAFTQQECEAVNFLAKNPSTRPKFDIDKKKDPILTGSGDIIKNPGLIPGTNGQQCHVVTTNVPATMTEQTCEQSITTTNIVCKRTLNPQCAFAGSDMSSSVTSQSGAFTTVSITKGNKPGLYDYTMKTPFAICGTEGTGEVKFNLDTVGKGSYITVNLSELDDTAALGVNGITVFAGHPNSGPSYSGSYFPQNVTSFQVGYSWTEAAGTTCNGKPEWDCSNPKPVFMKYTASAKLLDYCPSGYSKRNQFNGCGDVEGMGTVCNGLEPDSSLNVPGFFCNSEGKFLMNRVEGGGNWKGSLSTQMPLKVGENTIQAYWGTAPRRKACGNVTISGQIYNVAPVCDSLWNDGCAALRDASR